ncbi:MAG TPA: aldo/keto reductase, partial [Thermoanaerobaculia bacterium]|nr:aldo/keto reductase [Thermoanaerobaculia bacterium]
MWTRREYLQMTLAAGATLALPPRLAGAEPAGGELITRAIPATGERLPVVGLGSSATFSQLARG